MENLKKIRDPYRRKLAAELLELLRRRYGKNLVSVVIFGSVARGTAKPSSDLDVLVVCESFPKGMYDRMKELTKILLGLERKRIYKEMKAKGINTWVQFHPLRPEEARLHRPIYLDMVYDNIILLDRDGFMKQVLSSLKQKLRELGARRIFLKDGSWYWDLKPDLKHGEVLEI
jgi:predicted nucleotidyltransferase